MNLCSKTVNQIQRGAKKLYCSSVRIFPFAVWSRGWRSGNNSCHNLLIAHLKKTALPPINNFAPQQKIYTENRDIHSRTENDLHSFRWCIQLNCIMLSPQSLREAIVKSDVSLVIRLCLKVILIFENFKPSQKKDETQPQFSNCSYICTYTF